MNVQYNQSGTAQGHALAGLFTLSLRLVAGWTYFSAFWRRLVLENKLDPDQAGYIGEKFNHFLPNALIIKPVIEYLSSHADELWWAMALFTIVEALVGLCFMLGLFTRLMSVAVAALAMGILLSAGWLGTTCLDEWQIGVLGIAAGFTIFLSGGGAYSLDHRLLSRSTVLSDRKWFGWLGSGILPLPMAALQKTGFGGALIILAITLGTNQYFHGGVWGTLHNKSIKPHIEISGSRMEPGALRFTLNRTEGADVYGSFLIGIHLTDEEGKVIFAKNGTALSKLSDSDIANRYVAKVKPGKHSLLVPLGSKAVITINDQALNNLPPGNYQLVLTDISGITWTNTIKVSGQTTDYSRPQNS